MLFAHFFRKSLRNRLILGTGVMLLPLILLAGVNYYSSQKIITSLEKLVHEGLYELEPVSELQKLMVRAAMPANDYLIHGDLQERELFRRLSRDIDEKFFNFLSKSTFEEEKKLILSAYETWQNAKKAGEQLLATPNPVGKHQLGAAMERFDDLIEKASGILDRVHDIIHDEIDSGIRAAYAIKRKESIVMTIVFAIGLGTALISGLVLARSISVPLRLLEVGVFRFSQGDHSSRVLLDRRDELGHLARTFNLMAQSLEYDSMTGVYNRNEFHRRLKNEVERSLRYGHVVSLLMMDLDHFKAVNDTYGHQCGDEALRHVADVARRELRSSDMVARYGGEEFIAILPETPAEGACMVAERIRLNIATRPVMLSKGKAVNLAISIGVAVFPESARSEDALIEAADKALYAAKEAGRNRVCLYTPPSSATVPA